MNKHIFALFYPNLSDKEKFLLENTHIVITSDDLISRITHVLRLSQGDQCILFDYEYEYFCTIDKVSKKNIICSIISIKKHIATGTEVTVLLPLLKKNDFDSSLYALGAVGVKNIQLVTTEKTQRIWHNDKDIKRCQSILIAAAEQSKYFSMPTVHSPQPLLKILDNYALLSDLKILCDPAGDSINNFINNRSSIKEVIMLVGPEGGLTENEREQAFKSGFISLCLTPSILKAEHAIIIMSGFLRSIRGLI